MEITTANQLRNSGRANRPDWVNIVLIVFACSAAHAFPWQTLIVAYAVLGPGHYLTEVSWLHDRQYFACSRWYLPCACILAALLTVAAFVRGPLTPWLACALLLLSLFVALIDAGGWKRAALIATAGAAIVVSMPARLSAIALAIAILLPTVVHVFVFTAAFMMKGARRSGGVAAYLAVGTLTLATASFLAPISPVVPGGGIAAQTAMSYFQPIVDEFGWMGFNSGAEGRIFGFLGFAYAYHYLNWFSKVEIIRWHKVPPIRLVMLFYLWAAILVTYWINFTLGFLLSLILSNLHVLLEFPLNIRTLFGFSMQSKVSSTSAASAEIEA